MDDAHHQSDAGRTEADHWFRHVLGSSLTFET